MNKYIWQIWDDQTNTSSYAETLEVAMRYVIARIELAHESSRDPGDDPGDGPELPTISSYGKDGGFVIDDSETATRWVVSKEPILFEKGDNA
jgi:hypothetical protein